MQVISHRQVFHWHKQFRGNALFVAMKQSGRPVSISTNVTINIIKTLITDDSLFTQCEIAAHSGIAKVTVQKILKNCPIVVHNPIGVNFLAFTWMARTGMPFIQLTCNLLEVRKFNVHPLYITFLS